MSIETPNVYSAEVEEPVIMDGRSPRGQASYLNTFKAFAHVTSAWISLAKAHCMAKSKVTGVRLHPLPTFLEVLQGTWPWEPIKSCKKIHCSNAPIHKWGNWGPKWLSNLLSVTWLEVTELELESKLDPGLFLGSLHCFCLDLGYWSNHQRQLQSACLLCVKWGQ